MNILSIRQNNYAVSDFVQWHSLSLLDLNPKFQRRPNWKPGAKSFLIDSVLRGLPIPPVILRELPTNLRSLKSVREVVDGQQRLRTLLSFVSPNKFPKDDAFVIRKAHDKKLAGKNFTELSSENKQAILGYRISVNMLPATVADRDVLEIFARLNATGTSLNEQELRNAEYYGFFKTSAFQLGTEHLDFWRQSGIMSDYDIARMKEVELTSELMLLLDAGIQEGGKSSLDRAYKDFDDRYPQADVVTRRVKVTLAVIEKNVRFDEIPRLRNRGLFYCFCAAVGKQLFGLPPIRRSPKKIPTVRWERIIRAAKRLSDGSAPDDIVKLTERRSSHRGERIEITKYLLSE